MRAMLLAAGRGERMRPLTDRTPKPLLEVAGKPLIVHLIEALRTHGYKELVINHAHLGEQIERTLGDGRQYGVAIEYSPEPMDALETGGGIRQALPLLDTGPFLVVNADVWTDFPFQALKGKEVALAHLVLVSNPSHHPTGDFHLRDGKVYASGEPRLTYSGIGLLNSALFARCQPGRFPLAPLLREAAESGGVSGEHFRGRWLDVGTPQRLADLEQLLSTDHRPSEPRR